MAHSQNSLGKQPKLSDAAQRTIRNRYAEGETSLGDLAGEYRVGRSTIHRIIHHDTGAGEAPAPTASS